MYPSVLRGRIQPKRNTFPSVSCTRCSEGKNNLDSQNQLETSWPVQNEKNRYMNGALRVFLLLGGIWLTPLDRRLCYDYLNLIILNYISCLQVTRFQMIQTRM